MLSWVKNISIHLKLRLIELLVFQGFLLRSWKLNQLSNIIPKYFALQIVLISLAGL